jgi:two-component system LytT family response regulator
VEAVRNYTRVQARERRPRIIRRTMAEWEAILPGGSFGRVSRSLIMQLTAIRSMQWQSRDQTLVFFSGVNDPLPIGRAATARLKDLLPT